MSDKFTIRDFLVYFLTGAYLLLSLLYVYKNSLFVFFDVDNNSIKTYSSLYIFLLLPGLYLTGHLVQAVDFIVYTGVNKIKDSAHKIEGYPFIGKVTNTLLAPFLNHRVTVALERTSTDQDDFWKDCSMLIVKLAYEKADYWNIMHTLFEGLTLISFGWSVYFIIYFSFFKMAVSMILCFVFWNRSKQMASNFIKTVKNNAHYLASVVNPVIKT